MPRQRFENLCTSSVDYSLFFPLSSWLFMNLIWLPVNRFMNKITGISYISLFFIFFLCHSHFCLFTDQNWTKTTDRASLHSCRNVMFLHLLFMIQYNAKSRICYKCIPALLQETALCQELYSHPALSYFHPESCGGVYKGCYSVLKRRHQPLHPFHSKIMMLGTSASCLY